MPTIGRPRKPRGPLTPEQRQLAADYYLCALKIASRMTGAARGGALPDGLYEVAVMALFEAARKWQPGMGATMATLLGRYVTWRVRDTQRAYHHPKPRPGDGGGDGPPTPTAAELAEGAGLNPGECDVLRLIHGQGLDYAAAGRRLLCGPGLVKFVHREALGRVRDYIETEARNEPCSCYEGAKAVGSRSGTGRAT